MLREWHNQNPTKINPFPGPSGGNNVTNAMFATCVESTRVDSAALTPVGGVGVAQEDMKKIEVEEGGERQSERRCPLPSR